VSSGLANDDWDGIGDKGVRCWCVCMLCCVLMVDVGYNRMSWRLSVKGALLVYLYLLW